MFFLPASTARNPIAYKLVEGVVDSCLGVGNYVGFCLADILGKCHCENSLRRQAGLRKAVSATFGFVVLNCHARACCRLFKADLEPIWLFANPPAGWLYKFTKAIFCNSDINNEVGKI